MSLGITQKAMENIKARVLEAKGNEN